MCHSDRWLLENAVNCSSVWSSVNGGSRFNVANHCVACSANLAKEPSVAFKERSECSMGTRSLSRNKHMCNNAKFRLWSTSNGSEAIVVVLFNLSGSVLAILLQSHQYYINI